LVHEGRSFEAETRNLSLGGAFVELTSDIPFGATVRVQMRVPKSAACALSTRGRSTSSSKRTLRVELRARAARGIPFA
jgi:hypothetical protein